MSSLTARFAIVACITASAAAFAQSPAPAPQTSSPSPQTLIREAEQRMRELQAEADRLAAQAGTLLGQLRKLQIERALRVEGLRKAGAEVAAVNATLAEAARRLEQLETQRVAATPGVRERLVEIYKRGRGGYVRLLLAADDLQSLGRLSRGVAAVAELDRLRIDEHRRTIQAERDALGELKAREQKLAAAQADALKAREALDAAVAAHNRRIDQLDQQRDLAAQYVGELQTAAAQLQQRIAGLPSDTPATLPFAPFRGMLDWPVNGRIVSRFGRGTNRFGAVISRNGVEIAVPEGRTVRAVHGGSVSFAAPFVGYGNLVILDHGENAFTLYGHLQQLNVTERAFVNRGAIVGRAGRNPDGDEVVYFEVRIDGRPVDPVQWLRSNP